MEFLEDQSTRVTVGDLPRPPPSVNLTTTYTVQNVQAGDTINATCQIDFSFDESAGYAGPHTFADNALQWICSVGQPVNCEYFRFIKLQRVHVELFTLKRSVRRCECAFRRET